MKLYWYTQLNAEDGSYLKCHDSEEAAWEYVQHQLGDNPEKSLGRWYDDYGRSMSMFEATQEEADNYLGTWT